MALNAQDTYANWQTVQANVDWWSPTLSNIFDIETFKTMALLPAIKIVQFYVNNRTQDGRTRVAWQTAISLLYEGGNAPNYVWQSPLALYPNSNLAFVSQLLFSLFLLSLFSCYFEFSLCFCVAAWTPSGPQGCFQTLPSSYPLSVHWLLHLR